MKIYKNKFKDMLIFKSKKFKDKRGYFRELFLEKYIKPRNTLNDMLGKGIILLPINY